MPTSQRKSPIDLIRLILLTERFALETFCDCSCLFVITEKLVVSWIHFLIRFEAVKHVPWIRRARNFFSISHSFFLRRALSFGLWAIQLLPRLAGGGCKTNRKRYISVEWHLHSCILVGRTSFGVIYFGVGRYVFNTFSPNPFPFPLPFRPSLRAHTIFFTNSFRGSTEVVRLLTYFKSRNDCSTRLTTFIAVVCTLERRAVLKRARPNRFSLVPLLTILHVWFPRVRRGYRKLLRCPKN